MSTIEQRVNKRIKELEAEMEQFVKDANTKLGQYQAVIAELKCLVEPVQTTEVTE